MHTVLSVSPVSTLSALDLAAEHRQHGGAAYRVTIADKAEAAELLIVEDRAGLAWGANADWTNVLAGETPMVLAVRMLLTDEQIDRLHTEAGNAGDERMARICERALDGDEAAKRECARVIADAAAMS